MSSQEKNKIEIPPVHPTTRFEKRGLDAQPMPVTAEGMNLFDYFAAHAPDVPQWYFDSSVGVPIPTVQERMDCLIQWRIDYATSMCMMRNQMFSKPNTKTIEL